MSFLTILAVAIGLAVDAFAASMARGCIVARERLEITALTCALLFGGFQALMPLIGWQIGAGTRDLIAHWVAFVILAGIGGKTIHEGLGDDENSDTSGRALALPALLITAFATSIDALAAGFGFAMVEDNLWPLIAAAGVVTFAASWIGVHIGCRISMLFGKRVEIVGGLVLIAIGCNILYQHLTA
jgi:putative Mn2+ efflux pump MntP